MAWGRQRGCGAEQLCRPALCRPPHELAPLYVGIGGHDRAICYGNRTYPRCRLEHRLSVHFLAADRIDGPSVCKSPSLAYQQKKVADNDGEEAKPLTLRKIFAIPGAKAGMVTFFCYCALEQTTILWVSSYPALHKGVPVDTAAAFASLFCIGITVGRALSGPIANHISVSPLPIYLSVIPIVMVIIYHARKTAETGMKGEFSL